MDAYLKSINAEYLKYKKFFKELPKMDLKKMITKENIMLYKANLNKELQAVVKTINWSDKFIIAAILFHVLIFSGIMTSRCSCKQVLIIISLSLLSLSANYLNTLGMKNWDKFATKNYFDKNGSFMLLFINIPILIEVVLSMLMIICLSLGICGSSKCKCKSKSCAKKQKGKKPEPKAKAAEVKPKQSPKKPASKVNKKKIN